MNLFYSFSSRKAVGRYPLIFACNIAGSKLEGYFFVALPPIFWALRTHIKERIFMDTFGVKSRLTSCCLSC